MQALFDALRAAQYYRGMFWRLTRNIFILLSILFLGNASLPLADLSNSVRAHTRSLEFDYVSWTMDAIAVKLKQALRGESEYIEEKQSSQLVRDYMSLVEEIQQNEHALAQLAADPAADALVAEIAAQEQHLESLKHKQDELASLAEAILQAQLSQVIEDENLAFLGSVFPPVLFHSTPLPWALIVSPRDSIRQEANLSLETDLNLVEHIELENKVAQSLDLSTLVVPVGGIGSYPTMIAQSSNLNWLAEVIAHEWVHNYLTLRPLGLLYNRNQDLRTINETVANIAGKELGAALIARFYPDLAPTPPPPDIDPPSNEPRAVAALEPAFDFRAEMHATRIKVDALLAQGAIEQAEAYMEQRRLVFWEAGYTIRKLNQAYFAFYGSYADQAAGPAGEDPVGNAVRALRTHSSSLDRFVRQLAFVTSVDELMQISREISD